MICFHCKKRIPDGEEICPGCGAFQGFSAQLIDSARLGDQDAIAELYEKTKDNINKGFFDRLTGQEQPLRSSIPRLIQIQHPQDHGSIAVRKFLQPIGVVGITDIPVL